MSDWHIEQLIELVQQHYPEWSGFDHPPFLEDEIDPKRKLVMEAAELLKLERLDSHIAAGEFEAIWQSIIKLTQKSNLLWRRIPGAGDTAVLYDPLLNKSEFCVQIRNLLYGDRDSSERLHTFSTYLADQDLPNTWPLPTFLLFVTQPDSELFIKPQPAKWLLKFMGSRISLPKQPDGPTYKHLQELASGLIEGFHAFGMIDMIEIQSLIWIGMRQSKAVTGNLDRRSQIDLDVPRTPPLDTRDYKNTPAVEHAVKEKSEKYASSYSIEQMSEEIGVNHSEIQRWIDTLNRKGQIVFYGPPGTGKTFISQRLAHVLTSDKLTHSGFFEIVQFHPAYSYEDFVSGLRPYSDATGTLVFKRVPGLFLRFCEKARNSKGNCILIIDEINRANLPAVLGELMMMIEYRDIPTQLAGGELFSIPANVKIIATMNSADRSLALVDFALRRRFSFIHLQPNFDLLKNQNYSSHFDVNKLISILREINELIADPNYALGHTYFLQPNLAEAIENIWDLEILPYLKEYFFDSPESVEKYEWNQISLKIFSKK